MPATRRGLSSRRASYGFFWLVVGGTPVLLHLLGIRDRFNESGWYWLYGALAVLGVALLASGLRRDRD